MSSPMNGEAFGMLDIPREEKCFQCICAAIASVTIEEDGNASWKCCYEGS